MPSLSLRRFIGPSKGVAIAHIGELVRMQRLIAQARRVHRFSFSFPGNKFPRPIRRKRSRVKNLHHRRRVKLGNPRPTSCSSRVMNALNMHQQLRNSAPAGIYRGACRNPVWRRGRTNRVNEKFGKRRRATYRQETSFNVEFNLARFRHSRRLMNTRSAEPHR